VVPVENSTEGVVTHTLDTFVASPLRICGEVTLRIHHCLLGRVAEAPSIRTLYAHQQSLAQCREWLDANLPRAERVPVNSNAEAARRAAGEEGAGAVAARAAAEVYGLQVLAENIEDQPDNTTRFLVIGRRAVPPTGDDKTSLLVSGANRAGLLHDLLVPLARHGISMTRLESRPARQGQLWEYVFFIDIEGHEADAQVRAALDEMRRAASLFKVLGAYPRALA
jgi:chorismate mutase/prephenate dehydratase